MHVMHMSLLFSFSILLASVQLCTLAKDAICARLNTICLTNSFSRFLDYPQNTGTANSPRQFLNNPFPKNQNFWLRGIDFSCASPWNDRYGNFRAGTAISKRHIVFSKHFPLSPGTRIIFIGEDGGICPSYIEKTRPIDQCDIMIASLTADLTPNITPAKILPHNFDKYIGDGEGLPVVTFNKYEQAALSDLYPISTNKPSAHMMGQVPHDKRWLSGRLPLEAGDSGNPAFLLIGNQPILLYCVMWSGYGGGPSILYFREEIQKAMDELCPGHQLKSVDLAHLDFPLGDYSSHEVLQPNELSHAKPKCRRKTTESVLDAPAEIYR